MLCNISQNAMGQPGGEYPYPIMLCNISHNAMGQLGGGGGTLPGPAGGRTLARGGTLAGGYPGGGVPWQGGTPPARSGWRVPCLGGGTQVGQQKEYSLHGGRYASCVHAGGLSY